MMHSVQEFKNEKKKTANQRKKEQQVQDRSGLAFDHLVARAYLNKIQNAKDRNIPFELSLTSFKNMYKAKRCQLSGIPLELFPVDCFEKNPPNRLTIDRIDSKKGYVKGNVIAVAEKVNRIKSLVEDKEQGLNYDVLIQLGKKLEMYKKKGIITDDNT